MFGRMNNFTYDSDKTPMQNFNAWLSLAEDERYWNEEKPFKYEEAKAVFEQTYQVDVKQHET